MVMLDTPIAVALAEGKTAGLSARTLKYIDRDSVLISPAVVLELAMLHEIGRLKRDSAAIVDYLQTQLLIAVAAERFADIAGQACDLRFTRDPFDRLITAHAAFNRAKLVTLDPHIHAHFAGAID